LSAADRGDERALFSCVFLYGRDAPTRPAYIDDALCDVIGCHGYDVNIAAAAARRKMLIALLTTDWRNNETAGRYDTRCYFNARSKADMSQLFKLPHGNETTTTKSVKQKN